MQDESFCGTPIPGQYIDQSIRSNLGAIKSNEILGRAQLGEQDPFLIRSRDFKFDLTPATDRRSSFDLRLVNDNTHTATPPLTLNPVSLSRPRARPPNRGWPEAMAGVITPLL